MTTPASCHRTPTSAAPHARRRRPTNTAYAPSSVSAFRLKSWCSAFRGTESPTKTSPGFSSIAASPRFPMSKRFSRLPPTSRRSTRTAAQTCSAAAGSAVPPRELSCGTPLPPSGGGGGPGGGGGRGYAAPPFTPPPPPPLAPHFVCQVRRCRYPRMEVSRDRQARAGRRRHVGCEHAGLHADQRACCVGCAAAGRQPCLGSRDSPATSRHDPASLRLINESGRLQRLCMNTIYT